MLDITLFILKFIAYFKKKTFALRSSLLFSSDGENTILQRMYYVLNLNPWHDATAPESQGRLNSLLPCDSIGDHVDSGALFPQP